MSLLRFVLKPGRPLPQPPGDARQHQHGQNDQTHQLGRARGTTAYVSGASVLARRWQIRFHAAARRTFVLIWHRDQPIKAAARSRDLIADLAFVGRRALFAYSDRPGERVNPQGHRFGLRRHVSAFRARLSC